MPDEVPQPLSSEDGFHVSPGVGALLGALGLAGGTYAALRHRGGAATPGLQAIQDAANGKFTRVLSRRDPREARPILGQLRHLANRLGYAGGGDIRYMPSKDLHARLQAGDPEKIEGAVRHYLRSGDKALSGDVNLSANPAARATYDAFHNNKWKEYQILQKAMPGAMGQSQHLPEILAELGYKGVPKTQAGQRQMFSDLQSHLKEKYPKGFFLKDVYSANTGGRFPTDKTDFMQLLEHAHTQPYRERHAARVMSKIIDNPANAMVQERLDLQPGSTLGKYWSKLRGDDPMSTKEVRVHVINGQVMPDMTVPRFDQTMKITGRHHLRAANQMASDVMSKLPKHLQGGTYAMDIAPVAGGAMKVIETNPSGVSGLLVPKWNTMVGPQMHKAFTGQHSRMVSGLGAAGAGAVGAGAGALGAQALNQSEEPPAPPKMATYSFRR